LKEFRVADNIQLSEGLGIQGNSANTIDRLPEREFGRSSEDGGPTTSYDISRSEFGSTVNRSLDHAGPYRGDKEADERRAVERIRAEFNQQHRTNFDGVESEPNQDDPVDAWFTEGGQRRLGCQVTRSDGRTTTGEKLGVEGKFSESVDGQVSMEIMANAIQLKARKTGGKKDLVLVLDGVIPDSDGWVEDFKTKHAKVLASTPFVEVWYAGRHVGGVVKRLK
jgi:hypothetical protein